jgi:hypothetical protein
MSREVTLKSFALKDKYIELYADAEGTDCEIAIPYWIFNQIVEKRFGVIINQPPSEGKE